MKDLGKGMAMSPGPCFDSSGLSCPGGPVSQSPKFATCIDSLKGKKQKM